MRERFNRHAWRACVGASSPGVRIPPLPPAQIMEKLFKYSWLFLLVLGVVVLGGMWVKFSSLEVRHDHFWMLAESFWEGKTYFVNLPKRLDDTISWRGKYYWPLGPGPAVWLMPWVAGEKAIGWKVHRGYFIRMERLGFYRKMALMEICGRITGGEVTCCGSCRELKLSWMGGCLVGGGRRRLLGKA